jgi:hypothetical protein
MSIMNLVKAFVDIAKDLRPNYIEVWLSQKETDKFEKVTDFDMDMMLLDEKKCRASTYKRLANETQRMST